MLDIPRKMIDRNRAVRSAPTTGTCRQRSGSISPTQLLESIEQSNPTPQMLEVMERIRQKSQPNGDSSVEAIDSSASSYGSPTPKRRFKALKRSKAKPVATKWPVMSAQNKPSARKLKSSVTYEPVNEMKSSIVHAIDDSMKLPKKSRNKKCSVFTKNSKFCMSPRIPLQKLEINVKTTSVLPTTPTKRCSNRTVDSPKKSLQTSSKRKAKQKIGHKSSKALVTRSKSNPAAKSKTYSSSKVLVKKLSPKKLRNGHHFRTRVSLVVDLPSGALRCGVKPIRSAIGGSKRVIK